MECLIGIFQRNSVPKWKHVLELGFLVFKSFYSTCHLVSVQNQTGNVDFLFVPTSWKLLCSSLVVLWIFSRQKVMSNESIPGYAISVYVDMSRVNNSEPLPSQERPSIDQSNKFHKKK